MRFAFVKGYVVVNYRYIRFIYHIITFLEKLKKKTKMCTYTASEPNNAYSLSWLLTVRL